MMMYLIALTAGFIAGWYCKRSKIARGEVKTQWFWFGSGKRQTGYLRRVHHYEVGSNEIELLEN